MGSTISQKTVSGITVLYLKNLCMEKTATLFHQTRLPSAFNFKIVHLSNQRLCLEVVWAIFLRPYIRKLSVFLVSWGVLCKINKRERKYFRV